MPGQSTRPTLRLATYNVEWFNALFDNRGKLLEDLEYSARYNISRAEQIGSLGIVFTALDADGIMIIEGPDQGSKRSTVRALEHFARAFGLRTRRALHGFASETEQELAFLYDPDRITAHHLPLGEPAPAHGADGAPRFDTSLRADLDLDGVAEQIRFSKPPLELAVTCDGHDLRLIGMDKRGHGLSATPTDGWTLDDLAGVRCDYTTPIHGPYKGTDLYEHPPNGQGATAILMLNILAQFDLKAMDPFGTMRAHIEAEAAKLAYDARDRFIADPAARLSAFTLAKVLQAEQHPDADRLRVCRVLTDEGEKQIVCGAPNARAGITVVLCKPGDYVPGIDVTLGVGKIRGVESHGMMASERELELSDEHNGIIELASGEVGDKFTDWLAANRPAVCDPVIEVKITPNRPDALGVRGIARDLAARGLGVLKPLAVPSIKGGFASPVSVQIEALVGSDLQLPHHAGVARLLPAHQVSQLLGA